MPLDLTADLQSHCPELSPLILSSFLSWTGASQRCMDQSPLVCEHLLPLLVAPYLRTISSSHEIISPSSLCLQWAGPMHAHTHTHTHTHTQHKHTRVRDRDTNANRGHLAVHEEPLIHTKYRDFHISYRKISILICKCELYQSPTSMKEH